MTITNVTRSAWTQFSTGAARVQVFGGRLKVADSATPAADDFQVWPDGAVVDVASNKWGQALDVTPTRIVSQAP